MRQFRTEKIQAPRQLSATRFPDLPIDLEIGCGVGWHPISYARRNPERFLIAIEHTRTRFGAFQRRIERHRTGQVHLDNLHPVHANAISWVTHSLAPETLSRIFLLYPNPYPKKSRWHSKPFMGKLLETLRADGELLLTTNFRDYAEEAREWMTSTWGMELVEALEFSAESVPGGKPRTHFEKKYLQRGQPCFQLRFIKRERKS